MGEDEGRGWQGEGQVLELKRRAVVGFREAVKGNTLHDLPLHPYIREMRCTLMMLPEPQKHN